MRFVCVSRCILAAIMQKQTKYAKQKRVESETNETKVNKSKQRAWIGSRGSERKEKNRILPLSVFVRQLLGQFPRILLKCRLLSLSLPRSVPSRKQKRRMDADLTNLNSMQTCNSVTFYFMKISFSDIDRKWILPNMIRAGTDCTQMVLVNSHQRWKQTRNRVCFRLWCELTLVNCPNHIW